MLLQCYSACVVLQCYSDFVVLYGEIQCPSFMFFVCTLWKIGVPSVVILLTFCAFFVILLCAPYTKRGDAILCFYVYILLL